jgi:hypothetical protein
VVTDSLSEEVNRMKHLKSIEARPTAKSREASASDFTPVYKVDKADASGHFLAFWCLFSNRYGIRLPQASASFLATSNQPHRFAPTH